MCFLICIYIQNITFSILCDVVAINNMCSAHTSIHSYPGIRFEWTIHTWHNHRDQYLVVTVTLECLSKHKHTLTYTCTCTTTTIPSPSSTIYSFHRLLSIFFSSPFDSLHSCAVVRTTCLSILQISISISTCWQTHPS